MFCLTTPNSLVGCGPPMAPAAASPPIRAAMAEIRPVIVVMAPGMVFQNRRRWVRVIVTTVPESGEAMSEAQERASASARAAASADLAESPRRCARRLYARSQWPLSAQQMARPRTPRFWIWGPKMPSTVRLWPRARSRYCRVWTGCCWSPWRTSGHGLMVAVIGSSWLKVDKGLPPLQRSYAVRRYTQDAPHRSNPTRQRKLAAPPRNFLASW